MRKSTLLSAALCAVLTFGAASCSHETLPTFNAKAMDDLLKGAIADGQTLGVTALVFDEGQTVYHGAFGVRDRERELPMDYDTVFRLYSMTKPITSVLILQLAEEGKLSLDDAAAKYIPQLSQMKVASLGADGKPKFDAQTTPMTVRDLMLHRSGMGYGIFGDINSVETAWGKADLFNGDEDLSVKMDKLARLPLLGQPGEGWYYSFSTDVLGRIAEVVTGEELDDLFDARIFTPLGMDSTGFTVRSDQVSDFATAYQTAGGGVFGIQDDAVTSDFLKDNAYHSGGGGLVGTLGDYARFCRAMLDGGALDGKRILPEAVAFSMMEDQLDADDKYLFPADKGGAVRFGYGGGVVVKNDPKLKFEHGLSPGQWGWGGAAKTKFWIDRPNKAFAIIMMQQLQRDDPVLHKDFRALVWNQTRNEGAADLPLPAPSAAE
ncbi:MAG: serine hydrolase domain-containing protein [Robiginitomaculum sp.]